MVYRFHLITDFVLLGILRLYFLLSKRMLLIINFFFLLIPQPPRSTLILTLFPYTTLFRSRRPRTTRGPSRGTSGRSRSRWRGRPRSEEHTSELQSHSEISYAVFCLKKK